MSKSSVNTRTPGAAPVPVQAPAGRPAAHVNGASVEPKPATIDAVRKRAYEIYLNRAAKGLPGSAISDWAQAEKELHAKR